MSWDGTIDTTATATYRNGSTGTVLCTASAFDVYTLGNQMVTLTYSGLVGNAKTTGTRTCNLSVNVPAIYKLTPAASLYKWPNPQNIEWAYDQHGTYNYRNAIITALNAWEISTSKFNYIEYDYEIPNVCDAMIDSNDYGNTGWHGLTDPILKRIWLNDNYYSVFSTNVIELIAHEFGHANGLNDVSSEIPLMRDSGYRGSYYPTVHDLAGIDDLY